jgi:hypothetical protein
MAFKRLKSLFRYHEISVHVEQSGRAWFYGKLLLAALCETWVNKSLFPLCGATLPIKGGRYGVNNGSRCFIDCSSLSKRIWVIFSLTSPVSLV